MKKLGLFVLILGLGIAQFSYAQDLMFRFDASKGVCVDAKGKIGFNRMDNGAAIECGVTTEPSVFHLNRKVFDLSSLRAGLQASGIQLSQMSLIFNLKEVSYQNLHLEKADLRGAMLDGAEFTKAVTSKDCRGSIECDIVCLLNYKETVCDYVTAHLEGANFSGAHLRGAKLAGAHLEGANFSGADLRGADLRGAITDRETDFTNALR